MLKVNNCKEDTFKSKYEEFIESKRLDGVTAKTVETYRNHYRVFSKVVEENEEIDKIDWNQLILSIRERDLSEYSKISYLRTLKSFMRWLDLGLKLPVINKIETVKETYTDEELKRLIVKPTGNSFAEYRTWLMILLVVDTGIRASSLRNIKIEDIQDNFVNIRHTKTKKVQVLPFSDQTKQALRIYLKARGGKNDEYLFIDVYNNRLSEDGLKHAIRRYNTSRGVEKTSIHALRHTFAKKWLLDCGGNAFTLQKMLGHSTLDMTKHYCNIWDRDIIEGYKSPLENLKKERIKM